MFDGQQYVTRGVLAQIPLYLQNILWYLVKSMTIASKDSLQVFELEKLQEQDHVKQKIIHQQEQPPYLAEHCISAREAVSAKVFIIDNSPYSTMLPAEEY